MVGEPNFKQSNGRYIIINESTAEPYISERLTVEKPIIPKEARSKHNLVKCRDCKNLFTLSASALRRGHFCNYLDAFVSARKIVKLHTCVGFIRKSEDVVK